MGGFWGGLSLAEREMQRYEPRLVMPTPTPGLLVSVSAWKCRAGTGV